MFMCVVNLKSVNKFDLTWKQSFLIALLTIDLYLLNIEADEDIGSSLSFEWEL
jgi:hypothetical protein